MIKKIIWILMLIVLCVGVNAYDQGDIVFLGNYSNASFFSGGEDIEITSDGNYAILSSSGDDSFTIWDISNPYNVIEYGKSDLYPGSYLENTDHFCKFNDDYLVYASRLNKSITTWNISDKKNPTLIDVIYDPTGYTNEPWFVTCNDPYFYVIVAGNLSFQVYDWSDKNNPSREYILYSDDFAQCKYPMVLDETKNYIAILDNGNDGFQLVNITDYDNMEIVSHWYNSTYIVSPWEAVIKNDLIYLTGATSDTFVIVNISDKSNPEYVSHITSDTMLAWTSGLVVGDDYAIVTARENNSINIINITDKHSISLFANYTNPSMANPYYSRLDDGILYQAEDKSLWVWNASTYLYYSDEEESVKINWTGFTPLNNSVNTIPSLNYYFNVTADYTDKANCSFYWNETFQETNEFSVNISNSFTYTTVGLLDANITAYINCSAGTQEINSTAKYIYWEILQPTIATNTSDYTTINWPSLTFDINVSLINKWNTTAYCDLNDNVSWVSCGNTRTVLLSNNVTTFTCTATERNTEDVGFYANCSNEYFTAYDINSSEDTILITANSNPQIETNISGTFVDVYLTGFDFMIDLYNWTESSSCGYVINDSGITCSPVTFVPTPAGGLDYQYNLTCTPNYVQEKDYSITFGCNGTLYEDINSSAQTFSLDANVNPSVNWTNISLYSAVNKSFVIGFTPQNFSANYICGVLNSSYLSCNSGTFIGNTTSANLTCSLSEGVEVNETIYVQCNGTGMMEDYLLINSSSDNIFLDNVFPIFSLYSPNASGNTRTANNTPFTFNMSVEDNNTFAFEINCSYGGAPGSVGATTVYNYTEQDINKRIYSFVNITTIHQVGLIQCIANYSDDHTNEEFNVKSKFTNKPLFEIFEKKKDLEGYVGDLDFKIKDVYDAEIIKKRDRVSLKIKVGKDKDNKKKQTEVVINCPYDAFKRDTNPIYKEHWVCVKGIEGNWIDGNTEDNSDIVSSSYDPITKDITFIYETRNDEIVMESIGGLNYGHTYFNFTSLHYRNISFAANNAWNGSTISTFDVKVSNSSNTYSYSTTTGNITISLASGTYTLNQTAPTYVFGNLSTSYTTGGTSIYNTSFWQAELTVNVREGVSRDLITSSSINATVGGLSNYSLNSGTGTRTYRTNTGAFNVSGNASIDYFNNSYSSVTGTLALGNKRTIDLNLSRIFNVNIMREETNLPFNFTESNTSEVEVKITVICLDSETTTTVNTSNTIINGIDCDWTAPLADKGWYVTVRYPEAEAAGDTAFYYRFLLPSLDDTNVTIWLMELQAPSSDSIVETKIPVQDLANEYNNAIISVETNIDGYKEVIAQKIDFTKEVTLWLDENQKYHLYVTDDFGNKKLVDYLIAEAETATLVLPNIAIFDEDPNTQIGTDIQYIVNKDAGSVILNYTDEFAGFNNFTWEIYRLNRTGANNWSVAVENEEYVQTLIYNYTWYDGINITQTYSGLSTTETYITKTIINHKNITGYDLISSGIIWYRSSTTFPGFISWDEDIKLWSAIIVIMGVLLLFSALTIEYGLGISITASWIFLKMGWLDAINQSTLIGLGRITLWLSFFSVLTVILIYRKIQKTE